MYGSLLILVNCVPDAWVVALVAIAATRERIRAARIIAVVRLIRQRYREKTAIVCAVLSFV